MPVLTGPKTDSQKIRRARVHTYCIEAMMQDNRALQAGTSHISWGRTSPRRSTSSSRTTKGGLEYVWARRWGVSTRLVGGLIMTHGDDPGLVLPPRLAQFHVVIVPIYKSDEERTTVLAAADLVYRELKTGGIRVHLDARDGMKPGAKYYEWEGRGVPLRLEIGPRDVASGTSCWPAAPVARRLRSRPRVWRIPSGSRSTPCSRICWTPHGSGGSSTASAA